MLSSHTAPELLPSPSFSDVLKALEERGRIAEAFAYKLYVIEYLNFVHKLSEEEVLGLPMEQVNTLLAVPPTPIKYRGWDAFYWGEAAFE